MSDQYNANCACGEISLRLSKDIYTVFNCHCNDCRRHNGGAFTSYVASGVDGFEVTKGADQLARYEKSPSVKYYCSRCATPLYNTIDDYPNLRLFFLGALEKAEEFRPRMNVWCDVQLPWVNDLAQLKNFAKNSD